MSGSEKEYVVNETYRSSTDPDKDEFQAWLNEPIPNGIRNSGGIRSIKNPTTKELEFLVFITDDSASQNQNPWEDVINMEEGIARYWGDANARDNPHPENARGNGWVQEAYNTKYVQDKREEAPPVLLFEKPESGKVTFKGLCIISDLRIERHKDGDDIVVNYLIELAILDTDSVSLDWIHEKAQTGNARGGPSAWDEWVRNGRVNRYSVWRDNIRTPAAQRPDGRQGQLLENLRSQLDDPNKGEKL